MHEICLGGDRRRGIQDRRRGGSLPTSAASRWDKSRPCSAALLLASHLFAARPMNHFENEDYTDNQWPYRLGRIVYDNLVLMNFADHPARAQRISAILEAMPEIDIQAPYNHQKDIQRIVDSLVPILCRMHGKDEPREFMARFEAVMDIWDDIPHTTKSGKSLPVSQRRLVRHCDP